jgi:hypothetical protein
MRKVSAVGLVIGVLFLAVVFGIASIPDEVLESNSIEKSDGPVITVPKVPQIAEPETSQVAEPIVFETNIPPVPELQNPPEVEPETPQVIEPEIQQVAEPETNSEDTETNVIRVEVSDGVGTVSR